MPRKGTPDFIQRTQAVGAQMAAQDRQVDSRRAEERGSLSAVRISIIKPRSADTRNLNDKHVRSLYESIATLGLIEPLVIDQENVLLAGGHRLAALILLQKETPDIFNTQFPNGMIPVRIMSFMASDSPELALQIEIAENEQRRDYTPAEVRSIANHLRKVGYEDVKGRPKKGQKPLMPALTVVVGKNLRTIQRYLNEDANPKRPTDVMLFLKKAEKSLRQWQKEGPKTVNEQALAQKLPEFLELLERTIKSR